MRGMFELGTDDDQIPVFVIDFHDLADGVDVVGDKGQMITAVDIVDDLRGRRAGIDEQQIVVLDQGSRILRDLIFLFMMFDGTTAVGAALFSNQRNASVKLADLVFIYKFVDVAANGVHRNIKALSNLFQRSLIDIAEIFDDFFFSLTVDHI